MAAPGPVALGRSVILVPGCAIPAAWAGSPVVTIDDAVLADPASTVERLHESWVNRQPIIIEMAVDPAAFRDPTSLAAEPWTLGPRYEPWFDRLHHLVWANSYDARSGPPIWWWARKACRLGAVDADGSAADIVLPDGSLAWVDGGPRRPFAEEEVDSSIIHAESVADGTLATVPAPRLPEADLAPDQMDAVAHGSGPARVIAPAGSGKTRVLTERLWHLRRDRGFGREDVLAVAYNKQAQLELQDRTRELNARVRTLNSLGLWVLTEHQGSAPALLDERDARRLVERLAPIGRRRRANTDPVGPYVEAISLVRLGLRDPDEVEKSRDDVAGLAELFPEYRRRLQESGGVDFDEQVYRAIAVLVADGPFRRVMQTRCRHLLVDEFQDLTPAHVLLVRLLSLPALDVFGVGDDDQVIYQHAGADPGFLIDFQQLFPGAASHPLTRNYRCPIEVVDAAKNLLGYNRHRVVKRIDAGPAADQTVGAFEVIEHAPDAGVVSMADLVAGWLAEPGVDPSSIAVLARVNSLLLGPHVALHEAKVPIRSVLRPDVLDRTGMRAALAYLRIAGAAGRIASDDVIEVLRRPSRGLPPWFSDRLTGRSTWTTDALRGIAARVPDKDAVKVHQLVDDIDLISRTGAGGSTRQVLLAVRDEVGLGQAMGMLDRTGSGQGSSHIDDLEGLLQVADLHPEPATFESWLRATFRREGDEHGVTLSTVHRVKGREWDRVVVFGVTGGLLPHRLAEDREEERRVLHVALTRGRHRVAVLGDTSRRSPFLDELAGTAPATPVGVASAPPSSRSPLRATAVDKHGSTDGVEASEGLAVKVLGGYEGTVDALVAGGVSVAVGGGGSLTVRFGERVEVAGAPTTLLAPKRLWGAPVQVEAGLRSWRKSRAKTDGVPAYVVLNDRCLHGIAVANPSTLLELSACEGIGPAKLENYGDEILALVAEHVR